MEELFKEFHPLSPILELSSHPPLSLKPKKDIKVNSLVKLCSSHSWVVMWLKGRLLLNKKSCVLYVAYASPPLFGKEERREGQQEQEQAHRQPPGVHIRVAHPNDGELSRPHPSLMYRTGTVTGLFYRGAR